MVNGFKFLSSDNVWFSHVAQGLGVVLGCFGRLWFAFPHLYLFIVRTSIATDILVWHLGADLSYD